MAIVAIKTTFSNDIKGEGTVCQCIIKLKSISDGMRNLLIWVTV